MRPVFRHEHRQISNGYHDAPEEVACYACNKQIFKGCSSSVYSCTEGCGTFSLHKTCAELPPTFTHHTHQHHVLKLERRPIYYLRSYFYCRVCKVKWKWSNYNCAECHGPYYDVCLMCVILELQSSEDRVFHHPGHDKHPLTLVQRPAWFECDACGTGASDLSYVCTKCPFWMHQRCAFAPTTLEYKFHDNHPLVLAYSLPEQYRSFVQYCKICSEALNIFHWLYYCSDCRFFAHIKCVTSTQFMEEPPPTLRSSENENDKADLGMTNLVKLPPPDKSSVDLIMQQFVRAISLTDDNTTAPDHIKHWAHNNDHPLKLFDQQIEKKNTTEWFGANDDEMLHCDGCGRPISSGDLFYGCVICNYFLHKFCAQIPREIQPQIYPGHKFIGHQKTKPYETVDCNGCRFFFNGIHLNCEREVLCIGCASLPRMIKHEAHKHPLIGKLETNNRELDLCRACGGFILWVSQYICEACKICLHARCAIRAGTVRHRWDPHPLHLIYAPAMVMNHPHEFDCEICSRDRDTNNWFYHCAVCDLSLHLVCFDKFDAFYRYSYVKFGANNIKDENLYQHNLTFAPNKKKKLCSRCKRNVLNRPVLECAPCSFQLCLECAKRASKRVSL